MMTKLIRFISLLVFLVMILVGVYFSNNNTTEVALWLGFELAPQRVGVWIIMAFSIGGLTGLLLGFGLFKRIKYRVQVSQLKAQLESTEKQLTTLRAGLSKDLK